MPFNKSNHMAKKGTRYIDIISIFLRFDTHYMLYLYILNVIACVHFTKNCDCFGVPAFLLIGFFNANLQFNCKDMKWLRYFFVIEQEERDFLKFEASMVKHLSGEPCT